MSFLLTCPNCGKRHVGEFSFHGEYKRRPSQEEGFESWARYVYLAENMMGRQLEWWYHRSGCRRWFLARRNTTDNTDHESSWFRESARDL